MVDIVLFFRARKFFLIRVRSRSDQRGILDVREGWDVANGNTVKIGTYSCLGTYVKTSAMLFETQKK